MKGIATQIATVALALVAAGIALLLALAALYLALATVMTPALAMLGTSIAALMFAGLCLLIGRIASGPRQRPQRAFARAAAGNEEELASLLTALASGELEKVLHKNARTTALAALLVGVVVGFSPGLRKAIADLLKDTAK